MRQCIHRSVWPSYENLRIRQRRVDIVNHQESRIIVDNNTYAEHMVILLNERLTPVVTIVIDNGDLYSIISTLSRSRISPFGLKHERKTCLPLVIGFADHLNII